MLSRDLALVIKWFTLGTHVYSLSTHVHTGLRLLPEGQEAANQIMEKVTEKLKAEGFYIADDYINILGGDLEGVYGWLCVNYLLGKLGKPHSKTVAMTDMGGGSMQMAYAVSDEVAATAPEG